MFRHLAIALVIGLTSAQATYAAEIQGNYVEARTCQVYTGPCFANGEVGLAGKNAVLSWNVTSGEFSGVDLSGLSVAMVVQSSNTLGFFGLDDAKRLKSVIFVDSKATSEQSKALAEFVRTQTEMKKEDVLAVRSAPIEMKFDRADATGSVEVGAVVKISARKARPGDCICSNESAYYPPLVKLEGFVPGVTIEGDVRARPLGSRWSIPDSRTAYLGTFLIDSTVDRLASK